MFSDINVIRLHVVINKLLRPTHLISDEAFYCVKWL